MGREAEVTCHWKGEKARAKVLLESQEIILRGAIKARIPRGSVSSVTVAGATLQLKAGGQPLVLDLGAAEAAKWKDALLKAPPSLADKLGVSAAKPAFVIGNIDSAELATALKGTTTATPKDATQFLAVLTSMADLKKALKTAGSSPPRPLWCVYPKGKDAKPGDTEVRAAMRQAGFVDNKSCAVSATLTATRYAPRG